MVTESELVAKSAEFEAAVTGGNPNALAGLCEARAAGAAGEDAETWGFMRVLFCEEDSRRCVHPNQALYHSCSPCRVG